jgi:3-isopropylmalate/(R)-2-methylmalate dehydratase large subunit
MSGQTITEKILGAHSGRKKLQPGEFIEPEVDIALGNDITAPLAIKQFRNIFPDKGKVFDRKKVVIVLDHFTPNKDINSAEQCMFVRKFAREQELSNFYDGAGVGIEHALLPEKKIVLPGDLVIGADSHTCTYGALGAFSTGVGSTDLAAVWATGRVWLKVPPTIKLAYKGKLNKWVYGKDLILYAIGKLGVDGATYKSLEFSGEVIRKLSMSGRFTMCNMSIEAGAKNGIIDPDEITLKYAGKAARRFKTYKSDRDAEYENIIEFDCGEITSQVALPHLPSNTVPAEEVCNILIDQVVIGSCTNGWLEDLRIAAKVLKGKKINSNVRLLIFPATPAIYRSALKEGLFEIFISSGGIICPPTCGPCLGGHLGVLAEGEKCVATTNRNFVGRMGHIGSEVYLANPAVAAASAVSGRIAHPREIASK